MKLCLDLFSDYIQTIGGQCDKDQIVPGVQVGSGLK